jgi:hypothetical protein
VYGGFDDIVDELRHHGHVEAAQTLGRQVVAWYREAWERDSDWSDGSRLASALAHVDEWDAAEELLLGRLGDAPDDLFAMGYLGIARARAGDEEGAESMIDRLEALDRPYMFGNDVFWMARVVGQMSDCERAVDLLQRAHREGWGRWHHNREFEGIAGCGAFQRFMAPK